MIGSVTNHVIMKPVDTTVEIVLPAYLQPTVIAFPGAMDGVKKRAIMKPVNGTRVIV